MTQPRQPRRGASLKAWYGDWGQRLTDRLREHGFTSATEYVATEPTASLITLGHALSTDPTVPLFQGDGFAADQLKRRLLDEAKPGSIERCARDLLLRSLHEKLPEGWRKDWGADIRGDRTTPLARRASALGGWSSSIAVHFPEYDETLMRVALALRDSAMPEGWLPATVDDPLLVELFRRHWREPSDEKHSTADPR